MIVLTPEEYVVPEILLHATSKVLAPRIQRFGVLARAAWCTAGLAAYHARLLEDAGHQPIILSVPREELEKLGPIPDWDALHDPPLETVSRSVEALAVKWADSDADWKASLELLGSFCLSKNVPASVIRQHCPHIDRWADETRQARASQGKRNHNKRRKMKRS